MPRTSEALSPLCTWSRVYWVPPSPPSKDFLDQWIAAKNSQIHQKDSTGTLGALKKVAEWGVFSEISLDGQRRTSYYTLQAVSEPSLSGWPSFKSDTKKCKPTHKPTACRSLSQCLQGLLYPESWVLVQKQSKESGVQKMPENSS